MQDQSATYIPLALLEILQTKTSNRVITGNPPQEKLLKRKILKRRKEREKKEQDKTPICRVVPLSTCPKGP